VEFPYEAATDILFLLRRNILITENRLLLRKWLIEHSHLWLINLILQNPHYIIRESAFSLLRATLFGKPEDINFTEQSVTPTAQILIDAIPFALQIHETSTVIEECSRIYFYIHACQICFIAEKSFIQVRDSLRIFFSFFFFLL